jgi:hypothetical protein
MIFNGFNFEKERNVLIHDVQILEIQLVSDVWFQVLGMVGCVACVMTILQLLSSYSWSVWMVKSND